QLLTQPLPEAFGGDREERQLLVARLPADNAEAVGLAVPAARHRVGVFEGREHALPHPARDGVAPAAAAATVEQRYGRLVGAPGVLTLALEGEAAHRAELLQRLAPLPLHGDGQPDQPADHRHD